MNSKRKTNVLKKTLIILFIFFLPFNLHAKKLFVKISFGLASGGDVNDALVTKSEYYDYISMSEERESKLGLDIYLEFIYQVNSFLSFSVGNGYISKTLIGNEVQFDPPESDGVDINFTLAPEFSSSVIPICFSAIFSFPVASTLKVNFYGGMGYYFGSFESKTKWHSDLSGFSTWEYRSWNFKGSANTVGYHLGTGLDIDLSMSLFLSVEALYRGVNFKRIKSSGVVGMDTTFFQIRFFEGESVSGFDYRVSQISLSGVLFRTGLKFKF